MQKVHCAFVVFRGGQSPHYDVPAEASKRQPFVQRVFSSNPLADRSVVLSKYMTMMCRVEVVGAGRWRQYLRSYNKVWRSCCQCCDEAAVNAASWQVELSTSENLRTEDTSATQTKLRSLKKLDRS